MIKFISPIVIMLMVLVSCASVDQRMSLAPIDTDIPVSATKQLYVNGNVIKENSFQKSEAFTLTKKYSLPMKVKEGSIELKNEINSLIKGGEYNGVTELKFNIKEIDTSAVPWVALERDFSFLCAGFGGLALASMASMPRSDNAYIILASSFFGTGAALLGISYIHEHFGNIEYTIDISGMKVRY